MSNSNADEPPENYSAYPPPPSLCSLPDEIVLRCIALVPRSYHLNISWVSKHLRALVRSPELSKSRSTLHKSSLHVCFQDKSNDSTVHWLTLCPTEETEEYRLLPNPTPFPSDNYGSSTVAVGSKIFFIGESRQPSSDLWILDTLTGDITQGPSMTVPRVEHDAAVGVIDGKIYVIGGVPFLHEEILVEVFDPKSETWELAGMENVRKIKIPQCSASVEGKVYMVEYEKTVVYDPREREEGERLVQMVSERVSEGGRKEKLREGVAHVCVVEDVLFAFFKVSGLMWFDTKVNVWRRLVGPDGKEMFVFHADAVAEYGGKLAVLFMWGESEVDDVVTKSVRCKLVSLHRAGDRMCGRIDWSGVVGTVPSSFRFLHCVAVSD